MSKLVLFLFLGVCVMAVHMAPAEENDDELTDEVLDAFIKQLEPQLQKEVLDNDPRVNWKKVWKKAAPILKEVGKIAVGAAAAAVVG